MASPPRSRNSQKASGVSTFGNRHPMPIMAMPSLGMLSGVPVSGYHLRRRRSIDVPNQMTGGEDADEPCADVHLPPFQTQVSRRRKHMMVVLPRGSEGWKGAPEIIRAVISRGKRPSPVDMTERSITP